MTTAIILNLIFATAIFAAIVGLVAWAIATQSRDNGRQPLTKPRGIDRRHAPAGRPRTAHADAHRLQRHQGRGLA